MKTPVFCLCALLALSVTVQKPTFRSGVRTVQIYATVTDSDGRLVTDLQQGDFEVLDQGQRVPVTVFSNEVQQITVAMMLDMSSSMMFDVARVRDSAQRFIDAIKPGDRVRIGTFGNEVSISPLLTDDTAVLKRILQEELWPGGNTPLWRAMMLAMTSLADKNGRRVVLILTDGNDTDGASGRPSPSSVRERAVADDFMVYAIGMEPYATLSATFAGGGLDSEVVKVVNETGGGHFELARDAKLGETFARVAEELRHQYMLGFSPSEADGKTHKLEVRVTLPGAKVQARKSYVAGGAV